MRDAEQKRLAPAIRGNIDLWKEEPPMAEPRTVTVYIDYKSPYAYLAKDPADELARDFPVRLDWLPYRLPIPSLFRSASIGCPIGSTSRAFSAQPASTRAAASSRSTATRTNGGASNTATWIAGAWRAKPASSSEARRRSGTPRSR